MTPTTKPTLPPSCLPVDLGKGWCALFFHRHRGDRVRSVGLFHCGKLEVVLTEPAEVRRMMQYVKLSEREVRSW